MLGLYFLYITHRADGLSVQGPYDKRDGAEDLLLLDMIEFVGWSLAEDDEIESVLRDAYSKRGFEMTANKEGTDDITVYLRELEVKDEGV